MIRGFALVGIVMLTVGTAPGRKSAIIEYNRPPPTRGEPSSETHYLRGDLVRVDQIIRPATMQIDLLRQKYTRPGQPFSFNTVRTLDGGLVYVFVMDDALSSPPLANLRRWSGAEETHVGEPCRVWKAIRTTKSAYTFEQTGCSTKDGIELWQNQANIDAITATRIQRREVSAEAVRLPIETLNLVRLMQTEPGTDHRQDYDVLLEGAPGRTGLYRRSGNWRYVAETSPDSVSISVRNATTGVEINYSRERDGARRLGWLRPPYGANRRGNDLYRRPLPSSPTRTILGQQCKMYDLMVGVHDAGRVDCLTSDGIPLLSNRSSWGSGYTLEAKRFSRRPQPLADVMLPAALTDPAAWPTK